MKRGGRRGGGGEERERGSGGRDGDKGEVEREGRRGVSTAAYHTLLTNMQSKTYNQRVLLKRHSININH